MWQKRAVGPGMIAVVVRSALVLVVTALVATGCASTQSCPEVPVQPLVLPATAAALAGGRPVTIVALGSSSTAGAGASAPGKSYPARLEADLRAAWPGHSVTVINKGINGQMVDSMAARLDRDVLALHPDLLIWQTGANEALNGMTLTQFRETFAQALGRLSGTGVDVVLMDNQIAPQIESRQLNWVYGKAIAELAADYHVSLFSRTALMREWSGPLRTLPVIGPDGLHHTDLGYACLAGALAESIEAAVRSR